MPRNYKIYLNDIIGAIAIIDKYTKDISFGEFSKERMREDAVMKNLMVIGEAAKGIPREIRSISPETEWEEMAGLRDVLIHQYFGTELETIWDIIKKDLPKLRQEIDALLKKLQ